MNLQIINSIEGKAEYVLLPMHAYQALKPQIDRLIGHDDTYDEFKLEEFVNPIALARIKAQLTQEELAERMNVSQAYISKLEAQDKISTKILLKVREALQDVRRRGD